MALRSTSPARPYPGEELVTDDDIARHIDRYSFCPSRPGVVGIEAEWLVVDVHRPQRPVDLAVVTGSLIGLGSLPGDSKITYEPGGQVELSSAPAPDIGRCVAALTADLQLVAAALGSEGLALAGVGADPVRPSVRVVELPRYAAMAAYFDTAWPAGRVMMCSTASVQVNLEAGEPAQQSARWDLVHALGPVLVAAFANSPFLAGRPTGWRSTRQAVWADIDTTRTRPAVSASDRGPVESWARYAAEARVMLVQGPDGCRPLAEALPFGRWVAGDGSRRRPTYADLDYHLTTLFPPVRPRGWLELRMLDAQSVDHWPVAAAVATALLDDPVAADAAREACEPAAGRWRSAARNGLTDPVLARAAAACFAAAIDALPRIGGADLVPVVTAYAERYVSVGRCPADDLLLIGADEGPAAVLLAGRRAGRTNDLEPAWL